MYTSLLYDISGSQNLNIDTYDNFMAKISDYDLIEITYQSNYHSFSVCSLIVDGYTQILFIGSYNSASFSVAITGGARCTYAGGTTTQNIKIYGLKIY